MLRTLIAAAVMGTAAGGAHAQGAVDPAAMTEGEAIFGQHCAICHSAEGNAIVDSFPALRGNENLSDAEYVITNLHSGVVVMPPFPTLDDVQVAAVATYVRNSWGNAYGGVTPDEVAAVRATLDPQLAVSSIWDGVYTAEQAARGKEIFTSPCGVCHGSKLDGAPDDQDMVPAPPLARHKFLRAWNGRTVGALYSYTRGTMPKSNPGFMSEEDYLAIVAHMLAMSGAPAGDVPLQDDVVALGHIVIGPKP